MNELQSRKLQCPYCGETIEVLIDCSLPDQDYIEDCQVCCRPINLDVSVDHDGDITISALHENE